MPLLLRRAADVVSEQLPVLLERRRISKYTLCEELRISRPAVQKEKPLALREMRERMPPDQHLDRCCLNQKPPGPVRRDAGLTELRVLLKIIGEHPPGHQRLE